MKERIVEDLSQLRSDEGIPLFSWVRPGGPGEDDIMALLNISCSGSLTVRGQVLPVEVLCRRTDLSGNHEQEGIFVMAGPKVESGKRIDGASVLDIAPTSLYLLGLPIPEDMTGRLLEEAWRPEVLSQEPVRSVDTYETTPWRPDEVLDLWKDTECVDHLKSLGYL